MTQGPLPEDLKAELNDISEHMDVCLQYFGCDRDRRPETWYLDWAFKYEEVARQIPRL